MVSEETGSVQSRISRLEHALTARRHIGSHSLLTQLSTGRRMTAANTASPTASMTVTAVSAPFDAPPGVAQRDWIADGVHARESGLLGWLRFPISKADSPIVKSE